MLPQHVGQTVELSLSQGLRVVVGRCGAAQVRPYQRAHGRGVVIHAVDVGAGAQCVGAASVGGPVGQYGKGLTPSTTVRPMCISYPSAPEPSGRVTATRRVTLSDDSTVRTGSSPSPGAEPGSPSMPSGSATSIPIIWYPPQMPATLHPRARASAMTRSSPRWRNHARSDRVDLLPGSMMMSALPKASGSSV